MKNLICLAALFVGCAPTVIENPEVPGCAYPITANIHCTNSDRTEVIDFENVTFESISFSEDRNDTLVVSGGVACLAHPVYVDPVTGNVLDGAALPDFTVGLSNFLENGQWVGLASINPATCDGPSDCLYFCRVTDATAPEGDM